MACGAGLSVRCGKCGTELPGEARFCFSCGQQVQPGASTPRFDSPGDYTPKHLAEKILNSKAALEGERKQVTVLFADLKGSMELLADRDPEEARKILDPVLERMMEAVHHYEGTVNQVMGDGIMALFGAPLAHEDHAIRASYAALRMQESVKRYADGIFRSHGIPVEIRIGLNSGEVVVRAIGSDLHMDYTAVGQTTHLAARMEQIARPGSILISPRTLGLVEGYMVVKPLGPRSIKGIEGAMEVFELVGATPVRLRFHALARRGLTRLVGRAQQLDALRQALEQAREGNGQVVGIVGEPGVGKSRLYWEFTHSRHAQECLVLETGPISYDKSTSFLPVVELLRAYFKIEARDDARQIHDKVSGQLRSPDARLVVTLPAILWMLDVPVDDPQWNKLEAPQRRQGALAAVTRLLLRESQTQPLILVFEDLHWTDAETQVLLDRLVEDLPTARVLLLVNYRPEYEHAWSGKTYYRQLRLDPLPAASAQEFLETALGTDASLKALTPLLIERTEGNPFFMEESIRTLVETQALVGEQGAYRLIKATRTIQVPESARAILSARIDRLSPALKRLLQAAAVFGKDVPFGVLGAIVDLDDEELRHGLAGLQAAELLDETSLFPDLVYTFRHALTHEVAYGGLLRDRRRMLHAAIVEALERMYPDRLGERVEWLAHHAVRGEVWAKAVGYVRQAGARAAARSAHREAVVYFEQALVALGHLPERPDRLEQMIDVRFDLRVSLLALGELGRIADCLTEAQRLAETLGDQQRLGRLAAYLTGYFYLVGDQDSALEAGERALALASARGDLALQIEANYRVGQVYFSLGEYGPAIDVLARSVEALRGDLVYERFGLPALPSVISRTWLIQCLIERGDFALATVRGEEAVRIAETVDHPFTLSFAYWGLGQLYLRKGEPARAVPVLERGYGLCQAWNIRVWLSRFGSALGYAWAVSDRLEQALPLLEEAVNQAAEMRMVVYGSPFCASLGEAYLLAGRVKEATRLAERALKLARTHRQRGHEAWALRLLGEIAVRAEPPDPKSAESRYRQAIALARELEMRPLLARCCQGLGTLLRPVDPRSAEPLLTTAATLCRGMDIFL